jgi:ABC-type nitrate/sulfonate/bicarbonate transport system substrate-binding protein
MIRKILFTIRSRAAAKISLTVFLLAAPASPGAAQEAPKKLLVAYAGLISTHTSVWLGEDQGLYKKHGLDVTSVFTRSGSVTSQALIAGEARVASTSVGPTAGAISAGRGIW